jgi:hypothetical protein
VRRTLRSVVVSVSVSLVVAAAALGAVSGAYTGKTSQNQRLSFRIAGGAVRGFKLVVLDRCPDGHTLSVSSTYPTMTIQNGSFGGSFVPIGGHPGEKASLSGRVVRRAASGTVKDISYSSRERALCHGSLRFAAHHG